MSFGFECGNSGENGTGGAPVPPGLPAAVFEARMRENAREGQKTNNAVFHKPRCFFILRYFHLSIAARLTRAARGAARTNPSEYPQSKPNDIHPNFRNLKTENRKLE